MKISLIQSILVPELNCGSGKLERNCKSYFLFILAAFVALSGCKRTPRQEENDAPSALDHVRQSARVNPQPVAHGLTQLQRYVKFPFEVPAHVISPRVTGEFTSFIQGPGGAHISDESADVELMIMTEEQFEAFEKKTSAESVYAIEPSHADAVSIILPTTEDAPVHYYAVFRRAKDGKNTIWLNATLTAEFGSP